MQELELKPRFTEGEEAPRVWRKGELHQGDTVLVQANHSQYTGTVSYVRMNHLGDPDEIAAVSVISQRSPHGAIWPASAIIKKINEAAEVRRSDKPTKQHAQTVDKYLEVMEMQESLQAQAQAIMALAAEKGKYVGVLAQEIERFASEYENQTIRTKKLVVKLKEIPPEKSKSVSWKQYIDWSLGKFMAIGEELHKEAVAFLESTKRELPGRKELEIQKVESLNESILAFIKTLFAKLTRTSKKIDDLEAVLKKIG
jgi:hypothetical protein